MAKTYFYPGSSQLMSCVLQPGVLSALFLIITAEMLGEFSRNFSNEALWDSTPSSSRTPTLGIWAAPCLSLE